jgi:hypothetical protein
MTFLKEKLSEQWGKVHQADGEPVAFTGLVIMSQLPQGGSRRGEEQAGHLERGPGLPLMLPLPVQVALCLGVPCIKWV